MKKYFNKCLSIILAVATVISFSVISFAVEDKEIRFGDDGKFRIMQIADTQEIPAVSPDTIKLISAALDTQKPDLVVFTGRADNKTLPELYKLGLKHPGEFLEIFEVRIGEQVVQIPKTHLVFGKDDNVLASYAFFSLNGAKGKHFFIDALQIENALFFQQREQLCHNLPADEGIVPGSVVVKRTEAKVLGNQIQLKFTQLGN